MTVYKKITNSIFILTTDKVKPINLFNNLNISHILVVTIEELQKISGGSIHNFRYVLHYATATKFNGRDITIGFRCNYNDNLGNGGLPEFLHDRLIPTSIEKLQMGHFHWNDQDTSGWSLDVVMERMEVFYNKYTQ